MADPKYLKSLLVTAGEQKAGVTKAKFEAQDEKIRETEMKKFLK